LSSGKLFYSYHIWALDLIFARTIISCENNHGGQWEAWNITGDSISEDKDVENPVFNVYGTPISARGTELNRIVDRRKPVAGSSREERDDVDRVVRKVLHHLQSLQFCFIYIGSQISHETDLL